jgi:hypothetical protein
VTTPSMDRFQAERRHLLDEGNAANSRAELLSGSGCENDDELASEHWGVGHAAEERYRELLPDVPVSRCPFTGELLAWAMDVVDLDGWYWDIDSPIRRLSDPPNSFLTLTGAMRIREPVTWAPFCVAPGPSVPYVVPRILDQSETIAVIAQLPVGRHIGWPIAYFGARDTGIELENYWGDNDYYRYDSNGTPLGWKTVIPDVCNYDFELEPWISSGKLSWIAPGDASMTVRQGLADCPYVRLEGPRRLGFVEEGRVRYPS